MSYRNLTLNFGAHVKRLSSNNVLQSACDNRGSTLLEFAFAGPILIVLIFGIVEFGIALYDYNLVANGARLGARYAAVRGDTCDTAKFSQFTNPDLRPCPAASANVVTFVRDNSPGVHPADLTVDPEWYNTPNCPLTAVGGGTSSSDQRGQGCIVTVSVSYTFNFLGLPFLASPTMKSSSTLTITQ